MVVAAGRLANAAEQRVGAAAGRRRLAAVVYGRLGTAVGRLAGQQRGRLAGRLRRQHSQGYCTYYNTITIVYLLVVWTANARP